MVSTDKGDALWIADLKGNEELGIYFQGKEEEEGFY
jgi:hypothetical protein